MAEKISMTGPFLINEVKQSPGQEFGTWEKNKEGENIFVTPKIKKKGQILDVHEWIQAGREDTEIYAVLEKYGTIEKIKRPDLEGLYGDVTNIKGLRDIAEQVIKSTEMFQNLPLEIRREFDHDPNKFMNEAPAWLEKSIEASKKESEPKTEEPDKTK